MIPLLTIKQFFNDLRRQKLRSVLTMFGIFWGTCSIMLLFAFSTGIRGQQMKSQKGLGDNIAIVWPGLTSQEYRGLPKGRRMHFREDDIAYLKKRATTISAISPQYQGSSQLLQYKRQKTLRSISGVWPEFAPMRNVIPAEGSRFINELDMMERRRVVFLGNRLKADLFAEEEAVGETILVDGTPFTVIGVMKTKKQNSSYSGRDDRQAYIPSTTYKTMYSRRYVNLFVMQCPQDISMEVTKREVRNILGGLYKFEPSDPEALGIWDTTEGMAMLRSIFMAFKWFLVGIGIATLITGGIGVSNIMNVVLEERTKEIGIKIALGAKKRMILAQFVLETLLITAVGGILGFLFAYALISVFPLFQLQDYVGVPQIDMVAGITTITILGIVGLVSGFFPARRASNLQPVQALKLF
jgi:putative ABC transport system permease protein